MFIKQLQQFVNLLFNCKMSMIISPHIFSQIKRQPYSPDTSFSSKPSFKISPESLKAIYVIAVFIAILTFTMFYQTMDITFCSDASVAFPRIRADNRTFLYSMTNQRHEGFCFNIRNYLSPNLAASTQYSKYRGLERSSASSRLGFPLALAFVFPLTAYVGLINFNRSTKDRRDISGHNQTYFGQSTQNTPTINPCFIADTGAADASQKPLQNFDPFFTAQVKRQPMRIPLIFTASTPMLSSSNNIDSFERTSWTNFLRFHATIIAYLVAKVSHCPYQLILPN